MKTEASVFVKFHQKSGQKFCPKVGFGHFYAGLTVFTIVEKKVWSKKVGFWPFLVNKSGQKKLNNCLRQLKDCLIKWLFLGCFSMIFEVLVKYPLL